MHPNLLRLMLLAAGVSFFSAFAEDAKEGLWVGLIVTTQKEIAEYDGYIGKTDYDALVAGNAKIFVTLRKAFYVREKLIVRFQDIPGYGYNNQISLKADTITRIIPLRQAYVDSIIKLLDAPTRAETSTELEEPPPEIGRLKHAKPGEKSAEEDK